MDTSLQPMEFGTPLTFKVPMGHFRVPPGLRFKTRGGAQPLIWKSFFILMQTKLIFLLQPHFESEGFWNSEVAYSQAHLFVMSLTVFSVH